MCAVDAAEVSRKEQRMNVKAQRPKASSQDNATMRGGQQFEHQKQRILDVATALLNQKGLWGMTLQEVAGALQLATSSVSYYFKRREHLAAAVFEDSLARLAQIAQKAGDEATPRKRVARYVELYFDQYASALQGKSRPFAILSEIRSMDDTSRTALIVQYQAIFRVVRAYFGPVVEEKGRLLFTARAHILNEALFWSEIWLRRYAIGDFPTVMRRLLDILDGGLVMPNTVWQVEPLYPERPVPITDQEAFMRAATRLINDYGYKGASVERITGELNRNKTDFYRLLEGKGELVTACASESYRRLAELQRLAAEKHSPPWHQIATALNAALAVQFNGEYPLLRSSALQALPASVRADAVEQSERAALSLMGQMIAAMQDGDMRIVDPLIASHFVMSSINAAYDLKGWRTRLPLKQAVDTYADVIARGLFNID